MVWALGWYLGVLILSGKGRGSDKFPMGLGQSSDHFTESQSSSKSQYCHVLKEFRFILQRIMGRGTQSKNRSPLIAQAKHFITVVLGSSHALVSGDPNQLASNYPHPCICVQNLCVCSRFHSRSCLQIDQQCCAAQTHSIGLSYRRTGRCIPPTAQFSVGVWPYVYPPWPDCH